MLFVPLMIDVAVVPPIVRALTKGLVVTAVDAVKVPPCRLRAPAPKGSVRSLPILKVPPETVMAPEKPPLEAELLISTVPAVCVRAPAPVRLVVKVVVPEFEILKVSPLVKVTLPLLWLKVMLFVPPMVDVAVVPPMVRALTKAFVVTAVEADKAPPLKVKVPVPKGSVLSLPMFKIPAETVIAPA